MWLVSKECVPESQRSVAEIFVQGAEIKAIRKMHGRRDNEQHAQ